MLNIHKLNEKLTAPKEWALCPPYNGIGLIVDTTDLKVYETKFGDKEKFRFLIELNLTNAETGKNWIISSAPMSLSTYEMSSLFKFCKSIGVDCNSKSFDLGQLAGQYLEVIIKHVAVEGRTFANIVFTSKVEENAFPFASTYVPRPEKPLSKGEQEAARVEVASNVSKVATKATPAAISKVATKATPAAISKDEDEKLVNEYTQFFAKA